MKKLIITVQVIILALILVKVASVFGIFNKIDIIPDSSLITTAALAQPPASQPQPATTSKPVVASPVIKEPPAPPKDALEEGLVKQRDLAAALSARKIELDNRENALRADEQRLLALRKEITEKIVILKSQEEKLTAMLESGQAAEIKRYKDMAKVYEATPPAKAGPMLEKLDIKTAAGITMNMKKDKAGALWAFISPQKAVDITKEITKAGGFKE